MWILWHEIFVKKETCGAFSQSQKSAAAAARNSNYARTPAAAATGSSSYARTAATGYATAF